jgi:hypothetical protein
MKNLIYITISSFFILFNGCSDECDRENPTVQLVNNGTGNADIQIKTSGGNTENINNVEVGASSENRSFDPGEIEFTITIQDVNDPLVYNLEVYYCADYIVTVNLDNSVTGKAESRD